MTLEILSHFYIFGLVRTGTSKVQHIDPKLQLLYNNHDPTTKYFLKS